jgi:hypothetical protein
MNCSIHGDRYMTTGGCSQCPVAFFPSVMSPPGPAPIFNTSDTATALALFAAMRVEVWDNALEMAILAIESASDKQECCRRIRALRRSPQATDTEKK